MKKLAFVFVIAVVLPSLILAGLVLHSLENQQFVLERQQALLYQKVADSVATEVHNFLIARQFEFSQLVETMLPSTGQGISAGFHERVTNSWRFAQVGFVVTATGAILSPQPASCPAFFTESAPFLSNGSPTEVYWNTNSLANNSVQQSRNPLGNMPGVPQQPTKMQKRSVIPQQSVLTEPVDLSCSKLAPFDAEFRDIVSGGPQGTLARFADDKLTVLIWYRPPRRNDLIFGAQLALPVFIESVRELVRTVDPHLHQEICVALLDDAARPVASSISSYKGNWRHPLVATEIGEELPHWEAAVYLLNPAQFAKAATASRTVLAAIVAALLLTIGSGSWFVVYTIRREMILARQKTDFVSNVSHELKTPLTSIRMFSELLADGRVHDVEKQRSYLQIITAETGRLTRLINNVLDFARLDRGEQKFQFADCSLSDIVREACAVYRPQLEERGFILTCQCPEDIRIRADRDAISQIVLNLLSNAEKYSAERKEISVELKHGAGSATAELTVCDRGMGVPPGCEKKIFEQFFRAHDSLGSGIQGSGLGLTLAQRIAQAHGGTLSYRAREGGGSCFVMVLPIQRV